MTVQRVSVTWAEGVVRYDDLDEPDPLLDGNGLYAILLGKSRLDGKVEDTKLVYIGQAYSQSLRERIKQSHQAYACIRAMLRKLSGYEVLIMVGEITDLGQARVTPELYDDVECCLIHTNQPNCNIQCTASYSGRSLYITNKGGYSPLKLTSRCG